jgi:hemoglobin
MIKQTLLPLFLAAGLAAGAAQAQSAMPALHPAADPAPRDPALKPVFDAFGGKAGLTALMDDFMGNLMADPRTQPFFAHVDREHIKAELVDQFCVILDGPCTYTGKNMEKTHRGLDIHRSEFNALVEDLQKAMDKHGIPFRAQNKLLAKLAPMHREVVTK